MSVLRPHLHIAGEEDGWVIIPALLLQGLCNACQPLHELRTTVLIKRGKLMLEQRPVDVQSTQTHYSSKSYRDVHGCMRTPACMLDTYWPCTAAGHAWVCLGGMPLAVSAIRSPALCLVPQTL